MSFSTPSGMFFAIGLGAPDSCAVYWESADPPYFQSRGAGTDLNSVTYWYGGQDTTMPGSVRIDRASAFDALVQYVSTGHRPSAISWEVT